MTPYTPPEPAVPASDMIQNVDGLLGELFTLAQLRSEVERVRRETIEYVANEMDGLFSLGGDDIGKVIRSLK